MGGLTADIPEAALWLLLHAREPPKARHPTLGREAEAGAKEQRRQSQIRSLPGVCRHEESPVDRVDELLLHDSCSSNKPCVPLAASEHSSVPFRSWCGVGLG